MCSTHELVLVCIHAAVNSLDLDSCMSIAWNVARFSGATSNVHFDQTPGFNSGFQLRRFSILRVVAKLSNTNQVVLRDYVVIFASKTSY